MATSTGAALDVRVLRWRLTSDTTAVSDGAPVVTGIPLSSGRHSGCRLRFGTDGYLYVGTGDAAIGTNPQNLASLGGKVLRVGWDGSIPADNPFVARGGNARYVFNYGHRNVQGLALRPGTNELWTAEHGTDRDDEVNVVVRGANYGWDPVPGYDESTPMTDLTKFPSATTGDVELGLPDRRHQRRDVPHRPAVGGVARFAGRGPAQGPGRAAHADEPDAGPEPGRRHDDAAAGRGRGADPHPDAGPRRRAVAHDVERHRRPHHPDRADGDRAGARRPGSSSCPRASHWPAPAPRSTPSSAAPVTRSSCDAAPTTAPVGGLDGRRASPSTNAPSAASSAAGRVDLVTRSASGSVVHSWSRAAPGSGRPTSVGDVVAQHAASLGNGTLDVFAVRPSGEGVRKHWNGSQWGGWVTIGGSLHLGVVGLGRPGPRGDRRERPRHQRRDLRAGVHRDRGHHRVGAPRRRALVAGPTGRSATPGPASPGSRSAAASDRRAVVQRGSMVVATTAAWTSSGDLVSRPDGSFLMAGRGGDGALWVTDGGPSSYASRSLGGVVR